VIPLDPEVSPFAGRPFAQSWDGWNGRECVSLNLGSVSAHYIRRAVGPLYTHDALPYGIPLFVNDHTPDRAKWIQTFFNQGRSIRSSLSMYQEPTHDYARVTWVRAERSVIALNSDWRQHVNPKVLSKARQATRSGWTVSRLDFDQINQVADSIAATDMRHGRESRFTEAFFGRLMRSVTDRDHLHIIAATRDGRLGAFWLILSAAGYETGWFNAATDEGRKDGAITLLTCRWLEQASSRGARCIDLGVSPSSGVQKFKSTFGASLQPMYSGTCRWTLRTRT
jgi:hypothetical protein